MRIKVNGVCKCAMHFLLFDLSKGPVILPKCEKCGSQITISMIFREKDMSTCDFLSQFITQKNKSDKRRILAMGEFEQIAKKTGLNYEQIGSLCATRSLILRYLLDRSILTKPEEMKQNIPEEEITNAKKILISAGMKKRFINTLDGATLFILANIVKESEERRLAGALKLNGGQFANVAEYLHSKVKKGA